jgi:hypothetical protein
LRKVPTSFAKPWPLLGLAIVCLIGSATGCKDHPKATKVAPTPGLVAELSRSSCYGNCPVYDVSVYEDGSVVYRGREHVLTTGERTKTISPESIEALRQAFRDARFSESDDYSRDDKTDSTDGSTAVLYYAENGEAHRVVHYAGSKRAAPGLFALEDKLDEIVGTQEWVGAPDARPGHTGPP